MINLYYLSSAGKKIDLSSETLYAENPETLLTAAYNYETYGRSNPGISDIYAGAKEHDLRVAAVTESWNEFVRITTDMKEAFDADIEAGVMGRLYWGEYYRETFVVASEFEEYDDHLVTITGKLKLLCLDQRWTKEVFREFHKSTTSQSDDGQDYPYDYRYDYKPRKIGTAILRNDFSASDFKLIIYGPATTPQITINGHVYGLTKNLTDGERAEIVSKNKSILKYFGYEAVNWFDNRYKPQSIFEPIPSGNSVTRWAGTFAFDLTLYGKRSLPFDEVAEVVEPEEDIPDGAVIDAEGRYLLTQEDEYICLSM